MRIKFAKFFWAQFEKAKRQFTVHKSFLGFEILILHWLRWRHSIFGHVLVSGYLVSYDVLMIGMKILLAFHKLVLEFQSLTWFRLPGALCLFSRIWFISLFSWAGLCCNIAVTIIDILCTEMSKFFRRASVSLVVSMMELIFLWFSPTLAVICLVVVDGFCQWNWDDHMVVLWLRKLSEIILGALMMRDLVCSASVDRWQIWSWLKKSIQAQWEECLVWRFWRPSCSLLLFKSWSC